jgi:hypothetical protein
MEEDRKLWQTKFDVVKALGLSERTLERKIAEGTIRREFRNVPGRKPISILHPDNVAKLKTETLEAIPAPKREIAKATAQPDLAAFLAALTEVLKLGLTPPQITHQARPQLARVPVQNKLYLSLKEAADFSGLPQAYLLRKIKDGAIPAVKVPAWRIGREDQERHNAASSDGGGKQQRTAKNNHAMPAV